MRSAAVAALPMPPLTLDALTPADVCDWLSRATTPTREGAKPLRGRNIAVLHGGRAKDRAFAIEAAAAALGASVARVDAAAAASDATCRAARLMGQLYDAIACEDVDASTVRDVERESGVPVLDGLAADDHPIAALATLVRVEREGGKRMGALRVVLVGDATTRLATNFIQLAVLAGTTLEVAAPRVKWPSSPYCVRAARIAKATGAKLAFTEAVGAAIARAEVVLDDATIVPTPDDRRHALQQALLAALA